MLHFFTIIQFIDIFLFFVLLQVFFCISYFFVRIITNSEKNLLQNIMRFQHQFVHFKCLKKSKEKKRQKQKGYHIIRYAIRVCGCAEYREQSLLLFFGSFSDNFFYIHLSASAIIIIHSYILRLLLFLDILCASAFASAHLFVCANDYAYKIIWSITVNTYCIVCLRQSAHIQQFGSAQHFSGIYFLLLHFFYCCVVDCLQHNYYSFEFYGFAQNNQITM